MRVKLFGNSSDQVVEFRLLAEKVTEVEVDCGFKPEAVLLNSGNLGYARVVLDKSSIGFFLDKIG
jgi:hypothetical protein